MKSIGRGSDSRAGFDAEALGGVAGGHRDDPPSKRHRRAEEIDRRVPLLVSLAPARVRSIRMPCAGRKRHAMCSKPRGPISANGLRFEKFADEDAGSRNALKHLLLARGRG
jgi:hypothetical protein